MTIDIADDDASASTTHTVTVEEPAPESGLAAALPLIDELVATRKIPRYVGILWKAEVIAAQVLIGRGNEPAAVRVLQAEVPRSTHWSTAEWSRPSMWRRCARC